MTITMYLLYKRNLGSEGKYFDQGHTASSSRNSLCGFQALSFTTSCPWLGGGLQPFPGGYLEIPADILGYHNWGRGATGSSQ